MDHPRTGVGSRPWRLKAFSHEEREEIVRRYTQDEEGIEPIARRFGTTYKIIKRTLAEAGVHLRRWSPELTKDHIDAIIHSYVDDGESLTAIAARYGIHKKTLRDVLCKHGVSIRTPARDKLGAEGRTLLVDAYREGGDIGIIAKRFGCHRGTAVRVLRESGILLPLSVERRDAQRDKTAYRHIPRAVFLRRKAGAIASGNLWDITIHDVEDVFERQRGRCAYTGLEMECADKFLDYERRVKGHPRALSIDRRDSTRGYTRENIVLCCRFINYAKNALDEQVFRDVLRQTVESLSPNAVTPQFNPWEFGV